jgi:hypothetical protein
VALAYQGAGIGNQNVYPGLAAAAYQAGQSLDQFRFVEDCIIEIWAQNADLARRRTAQLDYQLTKRARVLDASQRLIRHK